jgi:hypothetical protein
MRATICCHHLYEAAMRATAFQFGDSFKGSAGSQPPPNPDLLDFKN